MAPADLCLASANFRSNIKGNRGSPTWPREETVLEALLATDHEKRRYPLAEAVQRQLSIFRMSFRQ